RLLEYETAEIIDRDPEGKNPSCTVMPRVLMVGAAVLNVTVSGTRNAYPDPPDRFRLTPDVDTLWYRYQMFLDGREPVQSMAYFARSLIEGSTGLTGRGGARNEAERIYNVERAILKNLGKLTSAYGSPREARKMDAGATRTPLTELQKRWMEEA